jgi:hypothetical protein
MPRHVHAFDFHAGAPRHFHVDERKGDRDAGAAVEHLVEKAVARILELDVVADEAQFLEQILVERAQSGERDRVDPRRRVGRMALGARNAAGGLAAERVELIEIRPRVEPRVLDARDHQGCDGEIGIGAESDLRETLHELFGDHAMRITQKKARPPLRRPGLNGFGVVVCIYTPRCWPGVRRCPRRSGKSAR